jgi:hypothetical protein
MVKAFGHVLKNLNDVFKLEKKLVKHAIPLLMAKTMAKYVILILDSFDIVTTFFNL